MAAVLMGAGSRAGRTRRRRSKPQQLAHTASLSGGRFAERTESVRARNSCNGYHGWWAIDIAGDQGDKVYAAGAGRASVISEDGACRPPADRSFGRAVVIDHGKGVKSLYAHLRSIAAVARADGCDAGVLSSGQWANSGSMTPCSFTHLHYEETTNGRFGTSATNPGGFKACHGSKAVNYPSKWGVSSWYGLAGHRYTARNDERLA